MKKLKFLIMMPYFERPKMVLNAIRSFNKIKYENYEIAIIDDGSIKNPIEEILSNYNLKNVKIYKTNDTIENKLARGSIHGSFMNLAMKESDADIALMLSDDDALVNGYLEDLNFFYNKNKDQVWSYCHVIGFDPMKEVPCETLKFRENNSWNTKATSRLNWTTPINPFCKLDATQVSWKIKEGISSFPENQTKNLDASFYQSMYEKFGPASFNGCTGVFKGFHSDQLTNREGLKQFQPLDCENKPRYLSICSIFKNESDYLKEWIEYHIEQGVDHFYLYNNESTDQFERIIKPYYDRGIITLKNVKGDASKKKAYEDFLKNHEYETFWCAFIDLDEFITTHNVGILEFLQDAEEYPSIGINWLMFGNSFLETKPEGGVLQNFIYCNDPLDFSYSNVSCHIKSISNPRKLLKNYISPHFFLVSLEKSWPCPPMTVDEDFLCINGLARKIDGEKYHQAGTKEPKFKKAFIRHFWCKSYEEFRDRRLMSQRDDNGEKRYIDEKQMKEDFDKINLSFNALKYEDFLENFSALESRHLQKIKVDGIKK